MPGTWIDPVEGQLRLAKKGVSSQQSKKDGVQLNPFVRKSSPSYLGFTASVYRSIHCTVCRSCGYSDNLVLVHLDRPGESYPVLNEAVGKTAEGC